MMELAFGGIQMDHNVASSVIIHRLANVIIFFLPET
jgi:hypothetical protein